MPTQNNINMGNKLYDLLPDIYKIEDSKIAPNPYPLQRYLQVLGGGMDALVSSMNDCRNLYNIDTCPDELLDNACNFYDFQFPANTSNYTKRRILKVLPSLYQYKGTTKAFLYLTRAMFGVTSDIEIYCPKYTEGMTAEELRRIFIKVQTDDKVVDIDSKMENFATYAEIIRPVNRKFIITLSTLFTDTLESGWANEQELITKLVTTYFIDDLNASELNHFRANIDKTAKLGFLYNIHSQNYLSSDIINLKLIEESYNMSSIGMPSSRLNKSLLNSQLNTMTSNLAFDKIKQEFDYNVELNVTETDVTKLALDVAYSKFTLNKSKLNRDALTSTSSHANINVSAEVDTKPKILDTAYYSINRPIESYSKLNKSKLNGGLVLTHKTHYDTIKIKGVIQQII